jgi:peroxiredoxin
VSARLVAGRQLAFPILSDPARDVIRGFGVEDGENEIAWPAIFIVEADAAGTPRVVWRWGADIYKERIPSAEVLAAVRAR